MNNVKALSMALQRSSGRSDDLSKEFETSLIKAGFMSLDYVEGQLDWMTWVGSCYLYDPDNAPILRRAFKLRWDIKD